VQRTLYQSLTRILNLGTQAETLLAEQQAILDSSPLGIAVIDGKHVVKCNMRLGELLGRRIQDLTVSRMDDHFVNLEEAAQFFADSNVAFSRGQLAHGMYRLKRADGTQFWAEFSGRKMPVGMTHSVWMVADVTLRVTNEARSRQRDPA
jgi:PAS domain S-box-containing protein